MPRGGRGWRPGRPIDIGCEAEWVWEWFCDGFLGRSDAGKIVEPRQSVLEGKPDGGPAIAPGVGDGFGSLWEGV